MASRSGRTQQAGPTDDVHAVVQLVESLATHPSAGGAATSTDVCICAECAQLYSAASNTPGSCSVIGPETQGTEKYHTVSEPTDC
jgi:hypothetical protein